jgi:hypothetical protein
MPLVPRKRAQLRVSSFDLFFLPVTLFLDAFRAQISGAQSKERDRERERENEENEGRRRRRRFEEEDLDINLDAF